MYYKLLISFVFFTSFGNSQSTNYYFSNSVGNDAWTGRLALPNASRSDGPKKTLSAFNNLLNSQAKPGDSLLFRSGDIWVNSTGLLSSSAQGTMNNFIIIGSYGTGSKPIINITSPGDILVCRGSSSGASSFLKFYNLQFETNLPVGSRPGGIFVGESFYNNKPHHLDFDKLTIRSCKYGMVLYQNDLTIQNCILELNGNQSEGQGIFCSARNVKFLNNVLDSNGCGSVFVHSVYISQTSDILFEGNEIKNTDDGLKLRTSNNLIIRNNRIHDTHIHSIHVGGDEGSGCMNIVIENNILYNVPNGLRISSESGNQTLASQNIIIRNNIFPAMVHVSNNGPVRNIFFYNNIFHSSPGQPAQLFINTSNPQNLQFRNNIFYSTIANSNHALVSLQSNSGLNGISFDNNLYYYPSGSKNIIGVGNANYQMLNTFRSIYNTQELNGSQGNPNFINAPLDFHLSAGSQLAIDKGITLDSLSRIDLDGRSRIIDGDNNGMATVDIGPYEYCCLLSTHDYRDTENMSIYPIPTSQNLSIQFNNYIPNEIQIINSSGLFISTIQTVNWQIYLDISNYSPGVYWIKSPNTNAMKRFIVISN